MTRNEHIRNAAVQIGEVAGHEYWVVPHPLMDDPHLRTLIRLGYNGYVVFKDKPVKEPDYHGILTYVPVHGGITYAEHDTKIGSVYGFDTGHCDSDQFPTRDLEWIKSQCEVMAKAIMLASTLEDQYLLAEGDNAKRAEICQLVYGMAPEQHGTNFGVNINLLFGQL